MRSPPALINVRIGPYHPVISPRKTQSNTTEPYREQDSPRSVGCLLYTAYRRIPANRPLDVTALHAKLAKPPSFPTLADNEDLAVNLDELLYQCSDDGRLLLPGET